MKTQHDTQRVQQAGRTFNFRRKEEGNQGEPEEGKGGAGEKALTQEKLMEVLDYNPVTGLFVRIKSTSPRSPVGSIAGTTGENGYVTIKIDGVKYRAHRLAILFTTGKWPEGLVDHKNHNTSDNSISNLRVATRSQNSQNQIKCQSHNKSKLLGVSSNHGKWKARIIHEGKTISLGNFKTPSEAHNAYIDAKRTIHEFCTI